MRFNKWIKKGIPERDISGKCNGCRDRVREGEESRQRFIDDFPIESTGASVSNYDANLRDDPPGSWGGHI